MQTPDDDFPYTSDDPSLAPVEKNAILSPTTLQTEDFKATLRLMIGSALNGKDVYIHQLRRVKATHESVKPEAIIIDENETFQDKLRYLLLGILFETPDFLQRSLTTAERVSSKVYGLFSKVLSPFSNSRVASPVKKRYDYAVARGEKAIDRLIMKGRIEEQNSRLTIQQETIDDLINDLLEYVVVNTKIRQIVQEKGVLMAVDMAGDFQEQSAAVDTMLEGRLKSIFRKRGSSQPVTPPNEPAEVE